MVEIAESPAKVRRSERLYLNIPIRLAGTTADAKKIREQAFTVAVSRHGARIRACAPLHVDQKIHITNLRNDRRAPFRVVGQLSPIEPPATAVDWAVECLEPEMRIWGLEFKDRPEELSIPAGLLECARCGSGASVELSDEELESLQASQTIQRECQVCGTRTPWRYARIDRRRHEAAAAAQAAPSTEHREGEERRDQPRAGLRLPIRVRTAVGVFEVSKTQDCSASGLRFVSEREYPPGTPLYVGLPYVPGEEPAETLALVEQVEVVPGSLARLYGVRFEPDRGRQFKRRYARAPLQAEVEAEAGTIRFKGEARDISVGGLLVLTPVMIAEGTNVVVRFPIQAGRQPIEARGRVVRAEPGKLAITFQGLTEACREEIIEFIISRIQERSPT